MSKPIPVPARPALSHTPLLASADGIAPSQPVSPGSARSGVSWSQSRETRHVDVTDLDADPLRQLATWLNAARAAGQPMPEAMTIASATSDAIPSARLVVLRGLRRGLVFFTDCESDEGAELAANPRAAAVLHWLVPAHRQVRAAGPAERVREDEADQYWIPAQRGRLAPKLRCRQPDGPGNAGPGNAVASPWRRRCSPSATLGGFRVLPLSHRVLAGIARQPARSDPLPPRKRRLDHRAAVAITIRRPEIPNDRGWRRTQRGRGPPGSMNAAVPRGRGLRGNTTFGVQAGLSPLLRRNGLNISNGWAELPSRDVCPCRARCRGA